MWCRVCKIEIRADDVQYHIDTHVAQYRSGNKITRIAPDTDMSSIDVTESIFSAFSSYLTEDEVDTAKKKKLFTKLFV